MNPETIVSFEKVNKWFGQFHVLRDIDLHVRKGERIVICGPSGSGKSTLIRCINRLEEHQQGRISVAGIELGDDLRAIDQVRKQVGMVFQQFNLFRASPQVPAATVRRPTTAGGHCPRAVSDASGHVV